MSSSHATVIAWSYGLAGLLYALFALRNAYGDRTLKSSLLLWTSAWTAVWGFSVAIAVVTRATWLASVGFAADVLVYAGWYAFLLALLSTAQRADSARRPYQSGALVALAVAVVASGLAVLAIWSLQLPVFADPGRIMTLDLLAAAILGLIVVEQVYRNAADESRWNVTPLCLGLSVIFGYDIYTFAAGMLFGRIDPDAWSVRGFVRSIALPLVLLSLARGKGKPLRIVLSRQVMFRSTALALSGLYLLAMAGAGYYVRYFGGEWGGALQVALVVAGLLLLAILMASGSVRARFRVLISKHFFSYRYDYREEWLRFTQALASEETHSGVGEKVVRGLADMVESTGGGLWLRQVGEPTFRLAARWNFAVSEGVEHADGGLVQFMTTKGWVINLEEYRSAPERYGSLAMSPWLSAIPNAWLVVPLAVGSELAGFVVLVTARTPIEVNWEVNDLLKTAGRQAASFLGHVQATEALLEARKFDSFNRMSAFVVHDLKNIIAQLSLMLRNAEKHSSNPEFQRDMLMTVEHSVERMKQLMLQLRDGTTPVDVKHRVDLASVAARIQTGKSVESRNVEVEADQRVFVRAHADRLERVIGHLVQNAIDATPTSGRVWIRISQQDEEAVVEVGDTGRGMSPEFVRDRLFKPFQTTKTTGMGIGAYESHQYVTELGGRVQVDSAPETGTRITLRLPLADAAPRLSEPDTAREHHVA